MCVRAYERGNSVCVCGFKSISCRFPTHTSVHMQSADDSVCVCVCVRQWQRMPMHSDAEVESPGSARKVINFYLLWRVNCNFNRAYTTTPTAHINTERETPHTHLVTHMQKPPEERVTTQQHCTGRINISHTRSDYGEIPLMHYILIDSATRTEWRCNLMSLFVW